MRNVVLEIETTGLDPKDGDRIVEIIMIETWGFMPTGLMFHTYINPKKQMPMNAFRVHGISTKFLRKMPRFDENSIPDQIVKFLGDSKILGWNTEFERFFLNAEFSRLGMPQLPSERFLDGMKIARSLYPGKSCHIDLVAKRYSVPIWAKLGPTIAHAYTIAAIFLEYSKTREIAQ